MNSYSFSLVLSGVGEITPEFADALFAGLDGEIELNQRDSVIFLEVETRSTTLQNAITDAIRQVERANVGVRVVRVETHAANVIAKINADLLGVGIG